VKVLLDSNVPRDLRAHLSHHETFTAKNGVLLKACEDAGFDVLVTGDKTLQYEQNLKNRKIAIVCLSAVSWAVIEPFVNAVVAAVDQTERGMVVRVECGLFSRKRKPQEPSLG